MTEARDAREEARGILGGDLAGRVLEPSPPAVDDGEFYADDPVHTAIDGARNVSPVGGDLSWVEVVADRPDLLSWAEDRWLVPTRRLPSLPGPEYVRERIALHRLATYVIAPARHQATGKFGLRWTKGGFGTPFFGDDRQVRVEGDRLVVQEAGVARSEAITSLGAAAAFIGSEVDENTAAEHDSPPLGDVSEDLGISGHVVDFLDAWWGMGTAALEQVRAKPESVDPSRVQMWPGHFDPAIELGDEDRRGSYGASPGDASSPEPYLYVSVWWPDRLSLGSDPFWNAEGYTGALLPFGELARHDEPVVAAEEFFLAGRDRLLQG